MEIKPYTEKAFVLVGEATKNYTTKLGKDGMHGKYGNKWTNKETGETFSGWMFSNKRRQEVEAFLQSPETYQPPPPKPAGRGRGKVIEDQQPTQYFTQPMQSFAQPMQAFNLQQPLTQTGLQRLMYDIKVPNVGDVVHMVVGNSMSQLNVKHVLSSKNNGLHDTLYLQGSDEQLMLAKVVNGEWQILTNVSEHKLLF
ncbi:Hypothetical protein ORPV_370 [Orpheovirus IHUMI-LCC2]|uniref:Uncharacterized protein n=1 Tax=Orpheovirus IHUMI-LCC2 TaxID=2023057 RepID=A0A2I2L416_9VIRU|nr:Hypothetical protein ORPV_370 [Orpheovirus IHUMI-LCC2]SNW62274.1 Hypothetical protein ORPV_370 [Orpheovirus IHUMI-LCC2]